MIKSPSRMPKMSKRVLARKFPSVIYFNQWLLICKEYYFGKAFPYLRWNNRPHNLPYTRQENASKCFNEYHYQRLNLCQLQRPWRNSHIQAVRRQFELHEKLFLRRDGQVCQDVRFLQRIELDVVRGPLGFSSNATKTDMTNSLVIPQLLLSLHHEMDVLFLREMSLLLLDEFPWHFVQPFMFPRGLRPMLFPRLFLHHEVDIFIIFWNVSVTSKWIAVTSDTDIRVPHCIAVVTLLVILWAFICYRLVNIFICQIIWFMTRYLQN